MLAGMQTSQQTTVATAASRSTATRGCTTAVAGATRATVATMTGHGNLLTADEGDGNDRDEGRDPKN
jgi:hypothetical protein